MTSVLRFYRTYGPRHAWWYVFGVIALVGTNWLSVTIPLYLAEAIDALRAGGDALAIVTVDAGIIAAMGLAIIVVRTLSRVLFFTPGRLVEAEVKKDLFAKLLRQQPPFHHVYPAGDLVSRASSDVGFVRLLAGFGAFGLANTLAALVLTVGQMVRLSPTLALWTLGPMVLALLAVRVFIQRMFRLVRKMQRELAELSDHILSTYQGIATVKGFVAEDAFHARFHEKNTAYLRTAKQRADMRALIGPLLGLGATVNVFVLLYIGGPMAIRQEISVGEFVAFTTLAAYLAGPMRGASFLLSIFKQSEAALQRIEEVTDPPPERPDLPDPAPAPTAPPHIAIRDLSFAYPDTPDTPVLENVSVDIPAGGTLGVLGATGSGKTTLVRVITRLFNPPPGTVFVDGVDVRDLDLDAWRRVCAVVPQRAFLFSESVKDNILLGDDDPERLQRVLAATAMDVDVAALPNGVDTLVGEAGVMLSGGQRQRTAIARGLARPHHVLVLDDVLSAVDHKTERELLQTLRAPADSPTTIVVANRISALMHADTIIVLDGGRVVDQGRHEDLCERPGLYRDTWLRQSEGAA